VPTVPVHGITPHSESEWSAAIIPPIRLLRGRRATPRGLPSRHALPQD
jgi:hypothetical protein